MSCLFVQKNRYPHVFDVLALPFSSTDWRLFIFLYPAKASKIAKYLFSLTYTTCSLVETHLNEQSPYQGQIGLPLSPSQLLPFLPGTNALVLRLYAWYSAFPS